MSERLRELAKQHIVKNGRVGKAQLCDAVGKSERTLDRWLENGVPNDHYAFKLAKALGCSDSEALRMAQGTSKKGQRTA